MINNRYDLLKYLFVHMSKKTQRYTDIDMKLSELVGVEKLSRYLTDLKNEGLIEVYIGGEIYIKDTAINFLSQLR